MCLVSCSPSHWWTCIPDGVSSDFLFNCLVRNAIWFAMIENWSSFYTLVTHHRRLVFNLADTAQSWVVTTDYIGTGLQLSSYLQVLCFAFLLDVLVKPLPPSLHPPPPSTPPINYLYNNPFGLPMETRLLWGGNKDKTERNMLFLYLCFLTGYHISLGPIPVMNSPPISSSFFLIMHHKEIDTYSLHWIILLPL